jgi:hypothetical protein
MHDDMAVSSYSHCPLIVSQLSGCWCCRHHRTTAAAGERGLQAINQLNNQSTASINQLNNVNQSLHLSGLSNISVLFLFFILFNILKSKTSAELSTCLLHMGICSKIGTHSEFVIFIQIPSKRVISSLTYNFVT